jgi:hypothetical protein
MLVNSILRWIIFCFFIPSVFINAEDIFDMFNDNHIPTVKKPDNCQVEIKQSTTMKTVVDQV